MDMETSFDRSSLVPLQVGGQSLEGVVQGPALLSSPDQAHIKGGEEPGMFTQGCRQRLPPLDLRSYGLQGRPNRIGGRRGPSSQGPGERHSSRKKGGHGTSEFQDGPSPAQTQPPGTVPVGFALLNLQRQQPLALEVADYDLRGGG